MCTKTHDVSIDGINFSGCHTSAKSSRTNNNSTSRYPEPTSVLSYPIDTDTNVIATESLCTSGVHTTPTISLATASHSLCIQHSLLSGIIQ